MVSDNQTEQLRFPGAPDESAGAAASPAPSSQEEAIRRAHTLVSPDLYVIERLKLAGVQIDYRQTIGGNHDEKIAALSFLAKQKLFDIENSSLESRDAANARQDLSNYVEVLFHLKAVHALGAFYDFAATRRESRVPWLWHNVCARCLYLMALMPECREDVLSFLNDHPDAVERLSTLVEATKTSIATALQGMHKEFHHLQDIGANLQSATPAPQYLTIIHRYEQAGPDEQATGISSLLAAQDRIQQAIDAGDLPSVKQWITEGSQAALQSVFHYAIKVMSTEQYIMLLEDTIRSGALDPVRLNALVAELGNVNRLAGPRGTQEVNRFLCQFAAQAENELHTSMARLAVVQLATVSALSELNTIMQHAVLLSVAEEALLQLRDLRRLPTADVVMKYRPELQATHKTAHEFLRELQHLSEAVRTCPSEDLAELYLTRLKSLKALPELQALARGDNQYSELARMMVADLLREKTATAA